MAEKTNKEASPVVDLAAENATLKARIAELEAQAKQNVADEKIIAEKMRHGLSREQALQVISRQRAYDTKKAAEAKLADEKKAAAPAPDKTK